MNKQAREITGATHLEAAGALSLAAVLLFFATPSMTAAIDSVKLSSASGLLLSGLHLARNQAISGNVRVVLCKSGDGLSCASTGGWEQGWIVFQDANANGSRDPTENILRREIRLSSSLSVYGTGMLAGSVSFGSSAPAQGGDAFLRLTGRPSASLRRPVS
jgi:type IV fimbrial biogenesis protein FimT